MFWKISLPIVQHFNFLLLKRYIIEVVTLSQSQDLMSGFHGYNAIDSFVLDMGNNLRSSSDVNDNDEYDN